ncbi:putative N-glycosylase/DNA lyase [Triangularia verruculosa]|uniref:DNA-(apurinic or apyrimidinic site) lyase n=1 Tax=Triangularia verruculosa TaxID=2587418 RepID=A0AAN6XDG2_9PEZI|nr:putative N-glycosylase/DNA lyase [Triangularia verruculosa]
MASEWRKLPLSLAELCIDTALRCGQSFRWRKINDEWHCVLSNRLITLTQSPSHLLYKSTLPAINPPSEETTLPLLQSYFSLSVPLSQLYTQWSATDPNFAKRCPSFMGIRILNQDAWETLISFICSSNNNISRICSMVNNLCLHYGPYITTVSGEPFHDFPSPEALSGPDVESHLRSLGFGYRAKYIADTARIVSRQRPKGWLDQIRNPAVPPADNPEFQPGEKATYRKAHEALLELTGVGPKVSDCVCLMGLGWWESVPIDTHVWQIAQRDYNFGGKSKGKTFTKGMYESVGDHFRKIWGEYAGWAQSVLFTANLKSFAEQAKAGKKSKKEEDGKGGGVVVKKEVIKQEVVKVVRSEEVTVSRTRKRKAVKEEEESQRQDEDVKMEDVMDGLTLSSQVSQLSHTSTTMRRVSKRLKARDSQSQ